MCDCIKRIVESTRETVKKDVETTTTVFEWEDKGSFANIGWGKNQQKLVAMPFTFSYTRRKINGEPEKKITNGYVNVAPLYCPFCGEKIDQ